MPHPPSRVVSPSAPSLPPAFLAAAPSLLCHRPLLPRFSRHHPSLPPMPGLRRPHPAPPGAKKRAYLARAPRMPSPIGYWPWLRAPRTRRKDLAHRFPPQNLTPLVTSRGIPHCHELRRVAMDLLHPASSLIRHPKSAPTTAVQTFATLPIIIVHCLTMVTGEHAHGLPTLCSSLHANQCIPRNARKSIRQSRRRP